MIKKAVQIILVFGLLLALGYLIYASKTIILYIVVSAVVALIGRPLHRLLGKIKIRGRSLGEGLRAFVAMLVMLLILGSIVGTIVPLILKELSQLASIDVDEVRKALDPGFDWFNATTRKYGGSENTPIGESDIVDYVLNSIDISAFPKLINGILGAFGNFLIAVFSVAFITFFLLKENDIIENLLLSVTPRSKEDSMKRMLRNIRLTLSKYFLGLLLQVTAIFTAMFIGLTIFGVKNAVLIALFTALANLIPYIGPWIGALFGTFIIVANNIEMGWAAEIQPKLIGLVITVAITQVLDNYLFQPFIFSNSLNAHPLEVFIVILIAGTIGGVAGMVAALPVYGVLRIAAKEANREWQILERIKAR